MIGSPMSRAAAALFRALVKRAGAPGDRIVLTDIRSVDWHSLTMSGERHEIALRVTGSNADAAARAMCDDLPEAEFAIPGLIVADIALARPMFTASNGSIAVAIEALTIIE